MDISSVLAAYPSWLRDLIWEPVSQAGFSGANIWCGRSQTDPLFALKAWPSSTNFSELHFRLSCMQSAREQGALPFIPLGLPTHDQQLFHVQNQQAWSLCTWQPGQADYFSCPSPAKLTAALVALAKLHVFWANQSQGPRPCFGIQQRVRILNQPLPDSLPSWAIGSELGHLFADLLEQCRFWNAPAIVSLMPYMERPLASQPCLCDIWHDHVLFEADRVTGLIDFGEVKLNHVTVDLARLLGDLEPDGGQRWESALQAYEEVTKIPVDRAFLECLHSTGVLCAVRYWLAQALRGAIAPDWEPRLLPRLRRHLQFLAIRTGSGQLRS